MTPTVIARATKIRRMTVDDANNLEARLPGRHVGEGRERAPDRSYYYAMDLTIGQIHQRILPHDIVTRQALENAAALVAPSGGAHPGGAAGTKCYGDI